MNIHVKERLQLLLDVRARNSERGLPVSELDTQIALLQAQCGTVANCQPQKLNACPDMAGWSPQAVAAYELAEQYRTSLNWTPRALGQIKRRLRALAKQTQQSDLQAMFYLDVLVLRLFGTDYDPTIKPLEFAQ